MKRALVLSGGGSKGSYEVGAVKALLENGRKYDIMVGVSAGALNVSYLGQFAPENQIDGIHKLEKIWCSIRNNKDVYKNWLPWFFTYIAALWKGSIYNMKPLKKTLIDDLIDNEKYKTSGVDTYVGCVSLTTGKYKCIHKSNQNFKSYILASSSVPVLFPPVKIDDEMFVDGGVREVAPLKDAINAGADEIDVVVTGPLDGFLDIKNNKKFRSAVNVAIRSLETISDEVLLNDINVCHKKGIKVNLYVPSKNVNNESFEFKSKEIKEIIEWAYKETKEKL